MPSPIEQFTLSVVIPVYDEEATVEELIYLGDHIRTRMNVLGHNEFVVKVPNSAAHARLAEGETINVGWKIEDCRALDA